MTIVKLSRAHATEAARLHIVSQPGTFLTSLGADVLTVLYRALPELPIGFGYTALDDSLTVTTNDVLHSACRGALWAPQPALVTGFVSATSSVGRLFVEMGTRRIAQFLPPLCVRLIHQPTLLWRSMQTLLYPLLARHDQGRATGPTAELLSIMVAPAARSQGVGAQLLQALLIECAKRQIRWLDVTVDANNRGARRFYERHHFAFLHQFNLYGRTMCGYQLEIGLTNAKELLGGN